MIIDPFIYGLNLKNSEISLFQVQRFKEMHHTDTDPDFILRKLEAIVDCYLDPQIPTEPTQEKVNPTNRHIITTPIST